MRIVLAMILVVSFAVAAQAGLSPEAQGAMKDGFSAAAKQDYVQAIGFFEEARQFAPDEANIYYNLGLAESKIPGRELRAIAWFGAYLTAKPDASNAGAVKEQISALNAKNLEAIHALIQLYSDTVKNDNQKEDAKYGYLRIIADFWTSLEDLDRAVELAKSVDYGINNEVLYSIAELQAKRGDFATALQTASHINSRRWGSAVEFDIAVAQKAAGDIEGSNKTIDQMPENQDPAEKARSLEGVDSAIIYNKEQALAKKPASTADWLKRFNVSTPSEPTLNQPMFIDVAAYVKAMAADKYYGSSPTYLDGSERIVDPNDFLGALQDVIVSITRMRNEINEMLKT